VATTWHRTPRAYPPTAAARSPPSARAVGVELAQAFANSKGSNVTIVAPAVLPRESPAAQAALLTALEAGGVRVIPGRVREVCAPRPVRCAVRVRAPSPPY
jgi:pyruvate/2-oxoglutarate dehydrogenase complex dihydrolipoamide dehydrogenase (E3) component